MATPEALALAKGPTVALFGFTTPPRTFITLNNGLSTERVSMQRVVLFTHDQSVTLQFPEETAISFDGVTTIPNSRRVTIHPPDISSQLKNPSDVNAGDASIDAINRKEKVAVENSEMMQEMSLVKQQFETIGSRLNLQHTNYQRIDNKVKVLENDRSTNDTLEQLKRRVNKLESNSIVNGPIKDLNKRVSKLEQKSSNAHAIEELKKRIEVLEDNAKEAKEKADSAHSSPIELHFDGNMSSKTSPTESTSFKVVSLNSDSTDSTDANSHNAKHTLALVPVDDEESTAAFSGPSPFGVHPLSALREEAAAKLKFCIADLLCCWARRAASQLTVKRITPKCDNLEALMMVISDDALHQAEVPVEIGSYLRNLEKWTNSTTSFTDAPKLHTFESRVKFAQLMVKDPNANEWVKRLSRAFHGMYGETVGHYAWYTGVPDAEVFLEKMLAN